jgi:hypothetical protein
MLTRDCGAPLYEVFEAGGVEPRWEEILPLYAEVQIDLGADAESALALGTPDRRPPRLPELAAAIGVDDRTAAWVARAVDGLGDALPATVAHEEVHEGNVFVAGGRPFFLDWAEACVSHPFVGPLLPLRNAAERSGFEPGSPEVERLRDLYLEPFTGLAPLPELREAFAHGLVLAALCRALSWDRILAPLSPAARSEHADRVDRWLEILGGVADGTSRLGEA